MPDGLKSLQKRENATYAALVFFRRNCNYNGYATHALVRQSIIVVACLGAGRLMATSREICRITCAPSAKLTEGSKPQ